MPLFAYILLFVVIVYIAVKAYVIYREILSIKYELEDKVRQLDTHVLDNTLDILEMIFLADVKPRR
jgi:hypothetical protein